MHDISHTISPFNKMILYSNDTVLQLLSFLFFLFVCLFSLCYIFLISSILLSYFSYQITSFKGAQYKFTKGAPLLSSPYLNCIFEFIFELRVTLCFSTSNFCILRLCNSKSVEYK